MQVKINKHVLQSYLKKLAESTAARSEKHYDKTQANFYGNYGSVKSFNGMEDDDNDDDDESLSPIEPTPQMANQITVDAPPVEDPYYVPSSIEELSLAASRIAREVPGMQIEYFYRKLHQILDDAIDESLNESIDFSKIHPMHKKSIEQAILQAYEFTKTKHKGREKIEGMDPEEAALFVLQNRDVKRYPDITVEDVLDELEFLIPKEQEDPEPDEPSEESLASAVTDVFVEPPGTLDDISPKKQKPKKQKPKKKRKIIARKKSTTTFKDEPSTEQIDKQVEDEMMDMLASAYSEHTEMEQFRKTWNWENYKTEAPYLNVLFETIKLLHELSYRVLQSYYLNKYGGYVYDADAPGTGKEKGGFVLEKQGPTSRPKARAMMKRIESDFGLNYANIMRQTNILKMDMKALEAVIERAMIGIFQRVPELYAEFLEASEGDHDIAGEALGFFASVIAHKYKGEAETIDRDLVSIAIAGIFKRCLLDLPTELGIGTKTILSLDALTKKKTQKTDKTYGFNLAGATKRFEKLRKDPKIAKQIAKLLPKLILNKIGETKTAKVTKKGSKYNFEDKRTGLAYDVKGSELKKKIKEYIDLRIKGTQPTFDEEQPVEPEEIQYDPDVEEKEVQQKLSKDDYQVRKMVHEMEKMVSSGDWMHIAPLFGFSGAPGVRSWYLRYPERKLNILTTARVPNAPKGAVRYLDEFRTARENLAGKLLDSGSKPGVLSLMIDEISSKDSLATSDQEMISLLSDMKDDIQELLDLYLRYEEYSELEREEPESIQRLRSTPGGSLLRFSMGSVFDKIIKDIDKSWQEEMQDYLELNIGLKKDKAKQLSYYFTGLKVKPSKGDFSEDREKLTKVSAQFVDEGIEWKEFNEALRYSQAWLFSTLDRELKRRIDNGKLRNNFYKKIFELTGEKLYKGGKLNKPFYSKVKKLVNGAIEAYLDTLAIEQFQQFVLQKVSKIKQDRPELFSEIKKFILKNM